MVSVGIRLDTELRLDRTDPPIQDCSSTLLLTIKTFLSTDLNLTLNLSLLLKGGIGVLR